MEEAGDGDGEGAFARVVKRAATYAVLGATAITAFAPIAYAADHPATTPPAHQELLEHELEDDYRIDIGDYEVRLPKEMMLPAEGGVYDRDDALDKYVEQGQYIHSWQQIPVDSPLRDGGLGKYHVPEEVAEELYALEKKAPDLAHVEVIGKSGLGNPIYAIRIGSDARDKDREARTEVLLVGQFHAREAIAVEVPLDVAKAMVDDYGKDANITKLVDGRDTWIIPSVNPDGGMIVAEQVRRYGDSDHRKTARDHSELVEEGTWAERASSLHGVDLNRNFSEAWGKPGASGNYWHQTYRGPEAMSEPEAKAMAEFVAEHDFKGTLAFHSYGGEYQYAPDYTTEDGEREELYRVIGEGMSERMERAYDVLHGGRTALASGTYTDWADAKGMLAYTVELEGGGGWGNTFTQFNPDEDEIDDVVENNLDAVLWFIEMMDDPEQVLDK